MSAVPTPYETNQVSRSHRHRKHVLPLTFAAIDAVNETKDMLHRRKLKWALDRLGEAGPLNVRVVSLKAILTPPQVLHHALYIAELADKLGLRIDSSSSLAAAIHAKRLALQPTDLGVCAAERDHPDDARQRTCVDGAWLEATDPTSLSK